MAHRQTPIRVDAARPLGPTNEKLRRFSMLHWKNRLALILMSVAAVASFGGFVVRGAGFYW